MEILMTILARLVLAVLAVLFALAVAAAILLVGAVVYVAVAIIGTADFGVMFDDPVVEIIDDMFRYGFVASFVVYVALRVSR